MKTKLWLSLAIAAQLSYLGSTIGYHHLRLKTGTRVLLKTEPVDPSSVFRGRYVTLNYEISTLPQNLLVRQKAANLKEEDVVYVVLTQDGPYWKPVSVHTRRPSAGTFLRGKVTGRWNSVREVDEQIRVQIRVRYGIETFFLSEAAADRLEHKQEEFRERGREMQRKQPSVRDQVLSRLMSDEDQRIKAKFNESAVSEFLDQELPRWEQSGWVSSDVGAQIKAKYRGAFERYEQAEKAFEAAQTQSRPEIPLTVEVSVAKDGTGYPTKLFWEGQEYR